MHTYVDLHRNTWKGPSTPDIELLKGAAPALLWERAIKQAKRSPMLRFKAGCVLFEPKTNKVISHGAAHPDVKFSKVLASIHAERHAISNCRRGSAEGAWALIYTLNGRGGCAWSSRPCCSCAGALYRADVERVIFAERTRSGGWTIITEHPEALVLRAPEISGLHARQQRIPSLR